MVMRFLNPLDSCVTVSLTAIPRSFAMKYAVHDIDGCLEHRVEKALEGKAGHILHTAGIGGEFPPVDELNG